MKKSLYALTVCLSMAISTPVLAQETQSKNTTTTTTHDDGMYDNHDCGMGKYGLIGLVGLLGLLGLRKRHNDNHNHEANRKTNP